MFYWLNYADDGVKNAPLVLWLQGGPGAGSEFAKFIENGPTDVYGNKRNTSWTRVAHMLYVDNPIGTGFSYSKAPPQGFATTDAEIAAHLVIFLQG